MVVWPIRGVVRLCPPLEIDGGESSRRAVDPGGLSAPTARRVPRMGERVRTAGLPGEDPVRPAGRCRIGARPPGAALEPRHGLRGSPERAGPARGLGVRIELLPLENGRAPEPLAALHAAADGESRRDAVHRELRRGGCPPARPPSPPPPLAPPPRRLAGLRRRFPPRSPERPRTAPPCGPA